mgnify:CR=1 FL=1
MLFRSTLNEKLPTKHSLIGEFEEAKRQGNKIDELRLEGKINATEVEIQGAQKQLQVLKRRVENLTVIAPRAGTIATFEVERQLLHRPVKRGELLLEIKDETGPWGLQLEVPEHRMGHLLKAIQAKQDEVVAELTESKPTEGRELKDLLDRHRSSQPEKRLTVEDQERLRELFLAANKRVDVEFQLATNVETLFEGTLREIETRSNPSSGKDKAVIHVRADIDKTKLPSVRIGAEVRAKINCGQRSLGYVLFGDVVEFIQKYFWL